MSNYHNKEIESKLLKFTGMSKKIKHELDVFPKELATAVNVEFPGANCVARLEFFAERSYEVDYNRDHENAAQIALYVKAYLAGNQELRVRVYNVLPE